MDYSSNLYDVNIRPIDSIEFNVWGNREIKKQSVVNVEITEPYDNMEPKRGSVLDRRLGVTSNMVCDTCGYDTINCIGHFGHIELGEEVFHMGYLKFVKKILSNICLKCSKLLIYKNEDQLIEMLKNKSTRKRFNDIKNITKNVSHCMKTNYGCGTPVSKIKIETKRQACSISIISERVVTEDGEGGEQVKNIYKKTLTPDICYDILKNISNSDAKIMGIDHLKYRPEDMIHRYYPVSPIHTRPSVKADFMESSSKEDDLTTKLIETVKANSRLKKVKESTNEKALKYGIDNAHLLQFQICTNFDNESSIMPRSEMRNKPTQSQSSRLKKKEGRIRGNLMGKRVNFCGRTVITGDPTIDIDELRVPFKMAKNLTFPETVTPENIEYLTKLVKNGKDIYPGANFVFTMNKNTGETITKYLKFGKDKVRLRYGDVVERHLIDGDTVLLNRQPSLHKLSMMAHRIKIIRDNKINTFGLNVAATTPYNADFDGDEMNIFVPQSHQTKIELSEIANVAKQIIKEGNSLPIIGVVNDGLIGAFQLSRPDTKIDWRSAMNIISYTSFNDYTKLSKHKHYGGNELFSLIIPDKINMLGDFNVKNGEIISGKLNSGVLGHSKLHGIIRNVWEVYGSKETSQFIDDAQKLINNFNLINGFTCGIGDIKISDDVLEEIQTTIQTELLDIDHTITELENNTDIMDPDTIETSVHARLTAFAPNISKIVISNLDKNNNFMSQVVSGAKGKEINISQMIACAGQTVMEQKRPRKKFNGRALPYFHQGDDSALGRGFITSPLGTGLNPIEYIFHMMGSREGVLDTAIKTAETGYIQRKLVKCLEDISVKYDGTVRNANEHIIQFVYSDNGHNNTKQSKHKLNFLELNNTEISTKIKFTREELQRYKNFAQDNDKHFDTVIRLRNKIRKYRLSTQMNHVTFDSGFVLPVDIRIIIKCVNYEKIKSNDVLEPNYILKKLNSILDYENTKNSCMTMETYNKKAFKYHSEVMSKLIFRFALYQYLSPKICINEYKLNKGEFDFICQKIVYMYNRGMVEPGEMVGVVAAQSMGEPATQMSCHKDTKIIIVDNKNSVYCGSIGNFIDQIISNNKNNVITFGRKNQVFDTHNLSDSKEYYIAGINKEEKVLWNKISQVSKHPANGKMVTVFTKSGRSTTATLSHSFLTRKAEGVVATKGSDLQVGDRLPLVLTLPYIGDGQTEITINQYTYELDYNLGYFCGQCINCGYYGQELLSLKVPNENIDPLINCLNNHNMKIGNSLDIRKNYTNVIIRDNKIKLLIETYFSRLGYMDIIPSFAFVACKEFIIGFLDGVFQHNNYTDILHNQNRIRFVSSNCTLINRLMILLSFVGVYSTKKEFQKKCALEINFIPNKSRVYKSFKDICANPNPKIDIIPGTNKLAIDTLSLLDIPNKQNMYGSLMHTELTRSNVKEYLTIFKDYLKTSECMYQKLLVKNTIEKLEIAYNGDVFWDEIIELRYHKETNEYVYDFTVPGTDSFMVDDGIIVHNTLNTFHTAGTGSSAMMGVPRVKDLLNLAKQIKTPTMTIYMENQYENDNVIVNKVQSNLKYITLNDIRNKLTVYYEPDTTSPDSFSNIDNVRNIYRAHNIKKSSCQVTTANLPWLVRIVLNKEKMLEKDISLLDIKAIFCDNWDKKHSTNKGFSNDEKTVLDKINRLAVLSNYDGSPESIIHIRFNMVEFDFQVLITFIDVFIDNFKLKGMKSIMGIDSIKEEPVIRFNKNTGEMIRERQNVIYTKGINMIDIRYLNGIDINRITCNDVKVIYDLFGIDAMREAIYKSFKEVFDTVSNVNDSHIQLLADFMTSTGIPISIDRHGIKKLDIDPLARSSFEKPVEEFINAAAFCDNDNMNSVSSRIMAGRVIKGGTGLCNIILDTQLLERSEYIEGIDDSDPNANILTSSSIINDVMSTNIGGIFIPN